MTYIGKRQQATLPKCNQLVLLGVVLGLLLKYRYLSNKNEACSRSEWQCGNRMAHVEFDELFGEPHSSTLRAPPTPVRLEIGILMPSLHYCHLSIVYTPIFLHQTPRLRSVVVITPDFDLLQIFW